MTDKHDNARSAVLGHVFTVGSWTGLSRVLGFVREMLQSRIMGADMEQSAFMFAFMIPNLARRLFGEGALTSAFVPVFKGEIEAGRLDEARRLARAVSTMVSLMLGAVVLAGVLGISGALGVFGRDFGERTTLILRLTRLTLPYAVFICAAAFGMGVLNAMGRFAAASLMPCLLNVFWIGALASLAFCGEMELSVRVQRVSWAILVAGAAQMAFMFWCMKRRGLTPGFTFRGWGDAKTRLVWKNTAIAAMGAGAVQINQMLDQVLGQLASPWAAGVIGYAERLMDLPLGVIGVAFGTVLLPTFAGHFAKDDVAGARQALVASVDKMLFVMIPAAAGLGVLAPEVTRVIYEGKAFDALATTRVARAVACYAIGLGFFGIQKSLVPWFHAQNDMKTPLAVSVKAVCLNAVLNILAVAFLPVEWKHVGLAASTVVCAGWSCVLLGFAARRRNGSLGFLSLVRPVGTTCLASAAMGAALIFARAPLADFTAGRGLGAPWSSIVQLAALLALGGAVYVSAILALRRALPSRLR